MLGASEASVLSHPEAVAALAATLVIGLTTVVAGVTGALPVLAVAVVATVAAPSTALSIGLLVVAALMSARAPTGHPATIFQVACSVAALAGAFVCTPDTEHAEAALGAIVGSGLLALAFRLPWSAWAQQATVLLVWSAVTDGWARSSAVVAVLAIAVVHLAAQQVLPVTPTALRRGVVTATTAASVAAIARHAGLDADLTLSLARAAALSALAMVAMVTAATIGRSPGTRGSGPQA